MNVILLSVILLSVILLGVILLGVILLCVILLSVILLSVSLISVGLISVILGAILLNVMAPLIPRLGSAIYQLMQSNFNCVILSKPDFKIFRFHGEPTQRKSQCFKDI